MKKVIVLCIGIWSFFSAYGTKPEQDSCSQFFTFSGDTIVTKYDVYYLFTYHFGYNSCTGGLGIGYLNDMPYSVTLRSEEKLTISRKYTGYIKDDVHFWMDLLEAGDKLVIQVLDPKKYKIKPQIIKIKE